MYTFGASISHRASSIGDTNATNDRYTTKVFIPRTYSQQADRLSDLIPRNLTANDDGTYTVDLCNIGTSMPEPRTVAIKLSPAGIPYRKRVTVQLAQNNCEQVIITDDDRWYPQLRIKHGAFGKSPTHETLTLDLCNDGAPMQSP